MTETETGRLAFLTRVADVLDAAGVEYAFVHNLDGVEQRDSDIDLVASRESLRILDTIFRIGTLGRLLQRIDYDVPWCRYYVVDTGDPERRFRQLDVACDPFGISRYGGALRESLSGRERQHGLPVVSDAAKVVYLAAKRSRKGLRGAEDRCQLHAAFLAAPAAETALTASFGKAGTMLARALTAAEDIDASLLEVGDLIRRRRNRPLQRALRAWFETIRIARRIAKPTGLTVTLAGPDGAGKSTLANSLQASLDGLFRKVSRLHLTPGLLPPPARVLRRPQTDVTQPHASTVSSRPGSLARIAYLAADTVLGWGPRVAAMRIRSGLVLMERGWYDLEVDPRRYRLSAGERIVRTLARVLPRPDLTLMLSASEQTIRERKPELDAGEIARQIAKWRSIASRNPARFAEVETNSIGEAANGAIEAITDQLAVRAGSLERFRTVIECLGPPKRGGLDHVVVSGRGGPRWILPLHRGGAGPRRAGLYRPGRIKHQVAFSALDASSWAGVASGTTLVLDPSLGLRPELEEVLGLSDIELAALLPTDPARADRAVLSILHGGGPVAIAKVSPHDSPELERESQVVAALDTCSTRVLDTPRLIGLFTWRGHDVLVTSPLDLRGRTDRALGSTEEAALVELASLRDRLIPVLDGEGLVPVHGDFCGWNTAARRRRLAVWDWEWAHMGQPLEDWFHWQTQRVVHFGRGSAAEIVNSALTPNRSQRELYDRFQVEPTEAAASLAVSLRLTLSRLDGKEGAGRTMRELMLARLEGRS